MYRHLSELIILPSKHSIFINFTPSLTNFLGVVPFVINLVNSPNLIIFHSPSNPGNRKLGKSKINPHTSTLRKELFTN